ncbi:MAG: enoyl-CoA hydratase/isomerase family protein, partial [Pyrinomonadaceae bacterium]
MHHFLKITSESGVVHIALENPDRSNAFAKGMGRELADALEEASSNSTTRVVVLSGGSSDRAFCSGNDLERMAELMEGERREEFERMVSV